jgi:glycosyltransferase involved in cell wall biosynthesis
MKSVAVMTAFNEEKRICSVILDARKYVDSVIVVDDGSSDDTARVSRKAGALVISYPKNKGKGHAVVVGLNKAISMKPDAIVFLMQTGSMTQGTYPLS